jgi:hypothetical protein
MQKQLENVVREGNVALILMTQQQLTISSSQRRDQSFEWQSFRCAFYYYACILFTAGQSLNVTWSWSAGKFVTCRKRRENETKNIRNLRSILALHTAL